jgi:hypothetical protein
VLLRLGGSSCGRLLLGSCVADGDDTPEELWLALAKDREVGGLDGLAGGGCHRGRLGGVLSAADLEAGVALPRRNDRSIADVIDPGLACLPDGSVDGEVAVETALRDLGTEEDVVEFLVVDPRE